ncbi:MAG: DUF5763 domain-containing protein [Dehalococcoidia bacterium]
MVRGEKVNGRVCKATKRDGSRCEAPPLTNGDYCFWHSPEHAEELAEAQRLGGLRRRKERTVAVAYDFEGLATVEQIRRLVEIAVTDTLGLENSVARSRTLAYLAQTATKLLEVGDFGERLAALEAAVGPRLVARKRR